MDNKKFKLYIIKNTENNKVYYGITSKSLLKRFYEHKSRAGVTKSKSIHLYNAMNKYGIDKFYIEFVAEYETREEVQSAEIFAIANSELETYNMTKGGDGGFVVQDKKSWVEKLKAAREGRTPAKGMKHSSENKKLFQEVSRDYWDKQDTYKSKVKDILELDHKTAKEVFGISTTHYYRLRLEFLQEK